MKNNLRILILSFLVISISFIVYTSISISALNSAERENRREVSFVMASKIDDAFNNELATYVPAIIAISQNEWIKDLLRDSTSDKHKEKIFKQLPTYLSNLQNSLDVDSVYIISNNSKIHFSNNEYKALTNHRYDSRYLWYNTFIDSNKESEYIIDIDVVSHTWNVLMHKKIHDTDGSILGIVGIGINASYIQDIIKEYEKEFGIKIYLTDNFGNINLSATDVGFSISKKIDLTELQPINDNNFVLTIKEDNSHTLAKHLSILDWVLVIIDEEHRKGNISALITENIIAGLCVLLLMIVLSHIIFLREKKIQKDAFTDQLTNLYNRKCYIYDIVKIVDKPLNHLAVISLDVNDLKYTNDNIGHLAGDELLRGAGKCISQSFSNIGKCYRFGGDEFFVLIQNANKEAVNQAIEKLDTITKEWQNTKCPCGLRISKGVAFSDDHQDIDLDLKKLSDIADKRMYENKEEFYRTHERHERKKY